MEIENLKNKLVAVLGYGIEGKATANYLIKHGIKPVLFDQRTWNEWTAQDQEHIKLLGVNFIFGPDCFAELKGFDVAFRSPGIKISQLPINNLQLMSQTKWFFEHCPAKIIGVTGTKGKGTTSALIYEILNTDSKVASRLSAEIGLRQTKADNSKTFLTGNIGKTQPLDILDDLKAEDWVVYELSSFQLQDLSQSPHIGVVLMVTSEHLDYHKDAEEYWEAKEAIVRYQAGNDFAVINSDFESSRKIGGLGNGKKYYFSRKKAVEPGCYMDNGQILITGADFRLPTSDLLLKGAHNLENVCAAVLATHLAGARAEAIKESVINFKGLEHRLEFVAEKGGVKFYNDSFSTIPETAIAAINSFSEPEILILGGSSKNSNFTELAKTIMESKNVKTLILIGQEAANIKKLLQNFKGQILEGANSMPKIFEQIKSVAKEGDLALLSPACASFGMFADYKDRGNQFKAEVLNVK